MASRGDTPQAVQQVLETECVATAVAKAAGGPEAGFVDEPCVRRYLRAAEGRVPDAASALAATLAWRLETRPAATECTACAKDPHSHNMRLIGLDNFDRPVLYTCFSQAIARQDAEASMQHLMRTLEDACAVMVARHQRLGGPLTETCVWLVDFHGYSFVRDSNPRTALLAGRLLAHYPERLGRAILLDAPRIFQGTWAAVGRIINAVTAAKVCFVRTDDGTFEAELNRWAGPAMRDWLLKEMADNRLECHQHGEKKYWVPPSPAPDGRPVHDARGMPEFVASAEFELTFVGRRCGPNPVKDAEEEPVAALVETVVSV